MKLAVIKNHFKHTLSRNFDINIKMLELQYNDNYIFKIVSLKQGLLNEAYTKM